MALYEYQKQVKELLLQGKSVLLQAPTGAGKTRAALAPFVEAFFDYPPDAFPHQCLYAVPTRVLATQFEREHRELADSYERRFRRRLEVTIQTGERPEDPMLMGDLVFATLDQVLSSALGVPYSLSLGRANLNVAAVFGSYLVFDEFHLFPREAAQTTLQLLQAAQCITPFVLMTATFSQSLLEGIAQCLNAVVVSPPPDEVQKIETTVQGIRKARRFYVADAPLVDSAGKVLKAHEKRTLVVCNTVERAIEMYRNLVALGCRPVPVTNPFLQPIYAKLHSACGHEERDHLLKNALTFLQEQMTSTSGPWALLLHSRFERPHRQVKEALLESLWGKDAFEKGYPCPSLILVSTQVVEVGLNVSAEKLHTDTAPAAAIIQRAGRDARYPGEQGEVWVYPVPRRSDDQPDYAPYSSKVEEDICKRSWEAFKERSGEYLHFEDEQEIVDAAHAEADRALLQAIEERAGRVWDLITNAMAFGETRTRTELIRPMDSRTVIVYEAPDAPTEDSPFRYEGFSLWHGTLRGAWKALEDQQIKLGLPWALRYPVPLQEEEESRFPVAYRWLDVTDGRQDVGASLLFAVHPALVAYDAELGFRLGESGPGTYRSPEAARRRQNVLEGGYRLESYADHIRRMIDFFGGLQDGRLQRRLSWLAGRLKEKRLLPEPSLLEKAVRLVIALHDVGKLDRRWQNWAARYQVAIGEETPPFLVAHTHYEPGNPAHEDALRRVRGKPSSHAPEGAVASLKILQQVLSAEGSNRLLRAALMAIARHHSSQASRMQPFDLHSQAAQAVNEALRAAGFQGAPIGPLLVRCWKNEADLENEGLFLPVPSEERWEWWLVYFALVRILRLCDGQSQEE